MRYVLAIVSSMLPSLVVAQSSQMPAHSMQHGQMQHGEASSGHNQHGQMTMNQNAGNNTPHEPGQSAFAAIQEIVVILKGDPNTDWSKVNVEALRQHLIDMNNVTLGANVKTEITQKSVRFIVTGDEPVRGSIQRMVIAHADTMNGVNGRALTAEKTRNGAILAVTAPEAELIKIKALGFIGVMTDGMHHQQHHLALARGIDPHHKH